jgi:PKD repeat protein
MGQWVAVWEDLRNGEADIYAQNIQPDGTLGVVIDQPPVADFTWAPSNPTPQSIVQFTDLSYDPVGYIVNWTWDFGDGNSSSTQHPTHQYNNPGTYTVCLTVIDNDGANDSVSKDVIVNNPSNNLNISIKSGLGLGITVIFGNNGSNDALIESWEITVQGGFLGRINKKMNGTIDIPAGGFKTIGTGMLFGFGAITITAKVADVEQTATGTQIIIFSMVKK